MSGVNGTCVRCGKTRDSFCDGSRESCMNILMDIIESQGKALELACNDAADGCCPYDMTDEYESEECNNCPNLSGNREDSQKDSDCWKKYYLQKAHTEIMSNR
jgi:hypothetical protein